MNYLPFYNHYKSELYFEQLNQEKRYPTFEAFVEKCENDPIFYKAHIYLFHDISFNREDVFQMIDDLGGWPLRAKSFVLRHQDNRACYFSEITSVRDGWNTSLYTSDDYYRWKLSPAALNEIKNEGKREVINSIQTPSRHFDFRT